MPTDIELARFNMVEQQIRPWDVLDKRVLEVFFNVPRERFVPDAERVHAFADVAVPIGHGQTMLPPVVEGRILQYLQVQPNERVLEIGTGTGFFTACLASLGNSVRSVDLFEDFTERAGGLLAELGFERVVLETGDAHDGWANDEHFDVIVFTGARTTMPEACFRQLNVGGRLLAITGTGPIQTVSMVTRESETQFRTDSLFETRTGYLIGAEPKPAFSL
ncbi:protein-L-isoaspartate O-methyltransferase [Guyparkeria hydrothermalis]|uniref:protein-L-isoaspartate O-methyltransferase family protein n=1 Tax=Guyparkeria hydrothermalis TaxID=923 RepID=UPI002020FE2A|nr:protein-L-isoaspartate O-methyltransferase [Guyparkeria hydrothermalis]MCL7744774.1 protein-L-isoaspartate O-methyltransferase [Guyparkeria hydrothermalis]